MERRWSVLLVTSVAVFMGFLDVTIVNIAFPDVRNSFPRPSLGYLSWILNAYTIVYAAALVPAGRLADRIGRRRSFLMGVFTFLAASVLCGAAWSIEVLIAGRVVQALGAAILVPTSLSLLLPEFPLEKRATATALWGATGAVAAAIGPSLGGVLVNWQGWRWVFFVNLFIGLPAAFWARRLLHESRDQSATLPDGAGSILLTLGVAAVSLAIVQGPDWGWSSPGVIGAFATSAVLLALFVRRSAGRRAPVMEFSLFGVRSFAVANVGVFVFSIGFYALLLSNVLFLTRVWDYSILRAGMALTPGPLLAAIAAPLGGLLSDRFGQRIVAVPGGLLFAAGAALFALTIELDPDYVSTFLPATMLTGAGIGLSFAAFGSASVAELPRARYATGSGISAASRQIGAVLGVSALIALLGTAGPGRAMEAYQLAWAFVGTTGAIAAIVALGLGRVRARHVEDPDPGLGEVGATVAVRRAVATTGPSTEGSAR